MKIEVLGPGCQKCDDLYTNTQTAVSGLGASESIEVIKVKDPQYFMKMGVFITPALVLDGRVVSVGKLLGVEEIEKVIRENL
jgi:small redox-active disulfide protein 2